MVKLLNYMHTFCIILWCGWEQIVLRRLERGLETKSSAKKVTRYQGKRGITHYIIKRIVLLSN